VGVKIVPVSQCRWREVENDELISYNVDDVDPLPTPFSERVEKLTHSLGVVNIAWVRLGCTRDGMGLIVV
jgi:hypothetical protein